jgi:hypothetical protein
MSDEIAELLYTLLASQSETGRKNYSVESAVKQIRKLLAYKACEAIENCSVWNMSNVKGKEFIVKEDAINNVRKALDIDFVKYLM